MEIWPLNWSRQRRILACGGLLTAAAAVLAYRSYYRTKDGGESYLSRLRIALRKYSEAFLVGSEVSSLLLSDLQSFLTSDSELIPQSFKQLLRLAESQEVQQSTSQLVSAAIRGAVEGASALGQGSGDMTEKILAALTSERGSSLLTLAISVACRTSTDALCAHLAQASAGQPDMMQRMLQFAGSREGQQLTTSSIRTFVREGTEVYMEKLEGTNTWADLLAAIGQGRNSAVMGGLTRVFVHELVNSYLNRPSASSRSAVAEEELTSSPLQPQSRMEPSCSTSLPLRSPRTQYTVAHDIPPAHHASCRVAVDATAKLVPAEMLPGIGDCTDPARKGGQGASSNASDSWANEVIQIVKVPEARKLMVALAATATAEGVRGSLLGVRDVLLGHSCDSVATNGQSWLQLPQHQLYVLICIVFSVVLYVSARFRLDSAADFHA
ncbi:g8072 [Coccomyxa elongata]